MDDLFPILAPIGIGLACAIFFLHLWPVVLTVGAGWGIYKWYRKWRFRHIQKADKHTFVRPKDWADFEPGIYKGMLYLGDSQDGTIRYWYDHGYLYPQAWDNGEMYWDKSKYIENDELRKKLNGFQEMGNEWPAYYQEVVLAEKRKRAIEKIKKQADEVRAEKGKKKYAATAASEFLNEHNNYIKDLDETVDQLRKEIEGYCPTIDFAALQAQGIDYK